MILHPLNVNVVQASTSNKDRIRFPLGQYFKSCMGKGAPTNAGHPKANALDQSEGFKLRCVVGIDQYAIHQLLLRLTCRTGVEV